ncbi:hypothetical protein Q3O60_12455 [Alkalimonas collagenimarina]|uniref:Uncharacterized protein n=1 Tax=Alkalimonas collagenimarina TaxID=400390 RepID=A0ABT9H107_9GAMM|nr:hypothetical protein [Alkalimonas collagenimarina]MDP4537005.1 hypothetical protein [Alkalimonas collagenimarina]
MKKILFIFTGSLIALLAYAFSGNSTDKAPQVFCPPKDFVVNLNIPPEAYTDKNFDVSDDEELALLMFPPEYVAESIENYQPYLESTRTGRLRAPLHVNVRKSSHFNWHINPDHARALPHGPDLYTDTDEEEFGWRVSSFDGEQFHPWGRCSDDFNGSLSCFRDLKVGKLWLKYVVQAENIAYYPEIDAFLTEHVTAWRCDSKQ